jgi:hypothetical protein
MELDILELNNMKTGNMELNNMKIDNLEVDSMEINSMEIDIMKIDNMELNNMELDNMELDSMKIDSIGFDSRKFDYLCMYVWSLTHGVRCICMHITFDVYAHEVRHEHEVGHVQEPFVSQLRQRTSKGQVINLLIFLEFFCSPHPDSWTTPRSCFLGPLRQLPEGH